MRQDGHGSDVVGGCEIPAVLQVVAQFSFQLQQRRCRVAEGLAVGGTQQIGTLIAHFGKGVDHVVAAVASAVTVLEIVQGSDFARCGHEVAAEADAIAVDLGDQCYMSEGVPGRRLHEELVAHPLKGLVILQHPTRAHALRQGEEALAHVVDVVYLPRTPEYFNLFEVGLLVGGNGDRDAPFVGQPVSLTLVPMVVGVKNPFHPGDPQVPEMIEHAAAAKIDEQGAGSLHEPEMIFPGENGYPSPSATTMVLGVDLNGFERAYPTWTVLSAVEVANERFGKAHVAVAF